MELPGQEKGGMGVDPKSLPVTISSQDGCLANNILNNSHDFRAFTLCLPLMDPICYGYAACDGRLKLDHE